MKNSTSNSNINFSEPLDKEIKNFPSDRINITPILNYIKVISPKNLNQEKEKLPSNRYFSSKKIQKDLENTSTIKKAYIDINKLTINHNTNLTNLNLYFLYNTENLRSSDGKRIFIDKNQNFKRQPEDTIRKKVIKPSIRPRDKNIERENNFKTRYHSIRYSIKRINSKSPLNNTQSLYRKNKKNILGNIPEYENTLSLRNRNSRKPEKVIIEPKGYLDLSEFTLINQIGKGTFGKIFSVKWKKNDKTYVLKKEIFNDQEFVEKRQDVVKIITDFLEKTKNKGVIRIYSSFCEKKKEEYNYYELMEMGERDWEKEINSRRQTNSYYTEKEMFNIASQLIHTLSLLQKNHITHRDIKPQNILIINGYYKLCDFGEIRIMKREGIVVQRIRGSELYMSPILFFGLRANMIQVKHNTYKSDVFSLGMCLLYAATMYFNCTDEIREMTDMEKINEILNKYLGERYSNKFISLIYLMLQVEENTRPDFIDLEEKLNILLIE